jgi:hypothetical protein
MHVFARTHGDVDTIAHFPAVETFEGMTPGSKLAANHPANAVDARPASFM